MKYYIYHETGEIYSSERLCLVDEVPSEEYWSEVKFDENNLPVVVYQELE